MAVRYNGLNVVNGNPNENIVGQIGDLTTLLQWNHTDPSDDFEMNRNNYIYTWQMNRNPFIDMPALADYIWGTHAGEAWFAALSNSTFDQAQIVMFPNPAQDQIAFSGRFSKADVEIYNLAGARLLQTSIQPQETLPLSLSAGMYLVKLQVDGQSILQKLMIK
jgi:hypothetical protein